MNITKTVLKRPVAVLICLIALIVFGASSILSTPIELTPDMDMPVMLVLTVYPGAGPEEVEELVTSDIESAIGSLSGVKTIQSQSSENMSMVMLQYEYGTNMDTAHMDLQEKLDTIRNSLPDTVQAPTIIEMSMDMMPSITLSAQSTGDLNVLNYVNDEIIPEFEKLSGVASVDVMGGREDYISVELNEERMNQYGLDINSIVSLVNSADFSYPAGNADQGSQSLILRGGVDYESAASLREMPITLRSGDIIHLSDIATIRETTKEADSISRFNGSETVLLSITKRQSASTISVSDAVIKTMESLNAKGTGIELSVVFDTKDNILSAVSSVFSSLLLGIAMSMLVLFVFLGDFKASLIVGTSMPVSLLTTLIIMSMAGISINVMSLGGLVIGVGMMVDNSIVVLESCFRAKSQGRTFTGASLEGTRVVTSSIIASTITTVVVFLPISLLNGLSGQLFRQVGFTIIFSLTASLISALTLVPLLFQKLKPVEKTETPFSKFIQSCENVAGHLIERSLNYKKSVVFAAIALLIVSFMMVPVIGFELMPNIDQGQLSISMEARPGQKLEFVNETMTRIETMVSELPDVERYTVSASDGSGSMSVYLKSDRGMETTEVVDFLREQTRDFVDCKVTVSAASTMSALGDSTEVEVKLTGTNKSELDEASETVKQMMEQKAGVISVSTSLSDGNPQAEIIVDPVRAAGAGFSPAQVVGTISTIMQGTETFSIRQNGQDYKVWVEYPRDRYQTVNDVSGIILTSPAGTKVPLMDIASIEYSNSPQTIDRENNQYIVSVTGQLRRDAAVATSNDIMATVQGMQMPEGVSLYMGGNMETMQEEFSSLFGALATAIFLVFMVMGIQFESIRFSIVVMMSIPFALIGAFTLLLISGCTISMTSLMGVIMLAGIVVNNGILLIDTTNRLRAEDGHTIKDALVIAGMTRLRPILMTTLTTVLSMVPMALAYGEGTEMMQSMALVIIGGLVSSTILTLFLIPTFYILFNRNRGIKAEEAEFEEGFGPGSENPVK